jgi:hypothetical protein
MKMKTIAKFGSASLMLLLMVSCAAPKPVATQPAPTAETPPATGVNYYFVTNKLILPTSQRETRDFAMDLDGDPQAASDNKFGEVLTLLTSAAPELELQPSLDQAIDTGLLVTLHLLKADDPMNDTSVSWSIFLGQKTQSPPLFDGTDQFTVDPSTPANSPIIGTLMNGHFSGGPGAAQVRIYILGKPVDVNLVGVRLEADVTEQGCSNGRLGGGLSISEFREKILPAIAEGLNLAVSNNPDTAKPLLAVFDTDKNGTISAQELEANPLLTLAIAPDLDLLDGSGNFNPRQDGEKDSFSMGLGFTCVPAVFITPED